MIKTYKMIICSTRMRKHQFDIQIERLTTACSEIGPEVTFLIVIIL